MKNRKNKPQGTILVSSIVLVGLIMIFSLSTMAAGKYTEAPELKLMVEAGTLPKVENRLPENPLVVQPIESIGKYGGTWRRAFTGIKDFHAYGRQIYDPILRWPINPKDEIQPGLAERWEWSVDGKELTLYLRKGLKWSDGEPFTTADITFWWNDIENDPNITPAGPHSEWMINDKPMILEVIDNTTIKLKFDAPNGLAERVGLAFHGNQWPLGFERFGFFAPRHYLEQFHPKYNKELTDYAIFEEKSFDFNTERPVMTAWQITEWGPGATRLVATRNPYYWKVDPEGQQLPYIDKISLTLFEDVQALNLEAINGNIDFQFRRMSLSNYPVFKENEIKGDYHILLWPDAIPSKIVYYFNQSIDDPGLREIFQNVKFRRAMSLAINRDEINEICYLGLGTPRAFTVVPDSPYYTPELEKLYATYDVEQAEALLDEIGLVKGADGFRTRMDGSPLEITIEGMDWDKASTDEVQLVVSYWNAVGVKTNLKLMNRDIYWPRATSNEVQVAIWTESRAIDPMVDPIWLFPFDERSWAAPAYGIWYKSGGKFGQEPTAEIKVAMDMYNKFKVSVDPAIQLSIAKELVKMSVENVYNIGTVGLLPNVVVVKNNFKNVPENFTTDWIYMAPGTLEPCHFYFDN
ncbi:MAG: ABC transporter substrate-binding protein [Candidatus Atribacteria bacterium]|nr:ABC transporter substrate-binding protein [Candidatus Atribacteria bacterium]